MERRVLLAISLSFLVLFLYQTFMVEPGPPPARPETTASTPPAQAPSSSATVSPEAGPRGPSAAVQTPDQDNARAPAPAPAIADNEAREVVVETDHVRAVFTNRGAELRSWRLKGYTEPDGSPVDLVSGRLPPDQPRPFLLSIDTDPGLTRALAEALFRPSASSLRVSSEPATLVFEYDDGAGITARKTFVFGPAESAFVVQFSASVTSGGQALRPTIHWGAGPGDNAPESSTFQQGAGAIFGRDGSATRLDPGDVREAPVHEGLFSFAGIDDHYFLAAVVPGSRPLRVSYEPVQLPGEGGAEPRTLMAFSVEPQDEFDGLRFFVGPKEFDALASVDRELVRAIHFGWFAPLVTPLLRALKWINGFVGNYGWSIIILTILINLAMFPLRHKSVVSMRKMQELQPEVKAIQDRYAKLKTTDPARQKMNVELMNLYRERGVNPASGCLPMLLTMPVLFAFYSLLSVAIEIRGAPFVGWIRDLSVYDPLYVTPVLMGLTMVWQQKITPTTADPTQQKIMMFMPIMFTFMFLWAPSGLVLYWLVSNLWGIGQQQVTNRLIGPPVVRSVRPAAERRVKNVGSAKTDRAKEGA